MIRVAAPARVNGDALASECRAAGLDVPDRAVSLIGAEIEVATLVEAQRPALQTVVAAHTGDPLPLTGERAVAADLRAKASAALSANDTFLALAAPSNAQTLTQVQRLTRECDALIRLVIGQLDSTTGT